MSALMTWQESPGTYAPPAAATVNSYMTALLAALNSFGAEAFSRWSVCSSDLASATNFITLKRKTGAPGRIVIIGTTANTTYAAPFGKGYVSTISHSCAYYPNATTDTPANFTTTGLLFDINTETTGISSQYSNLVTTHRFKIFDCEDGMVIVQTAVGGAFSGIIRIVGDLLDDKDGNAIAFAGHDFDATTGLAYVTTPQSPNNNNTWFAAGDAVGSFLIHPSVQYNQYSTSLQRDVANGEAWFLPIIMGHSARPYANLHAYKLRQIAWGPNTSIADERLFITGPVVAALNTKISNGGSFPWLTQFIV